MYRDLRASEFGAVHAESTLRPPRPSERTTLRKLRVSLPKTRTLPETSPGLLRFGMRIIASDLLWSLLFASAKTHLEVPHEFLEGLRRRLSRQSQHVYSRRHIAAATRNGRAVAGLV